VLKIRLRAELHKRPVRELPQQRSPESLAIFEPRAPARGVAIGRMIEVGQRQLTPTASETLDLDFQPAAALGHNPLHPSHQVAFFVPSFDGHRLAAGGQREVFGF